MRAPNPFLFVPSFCRQFCSFGVAGCGRGRKWRHACTIPPHGRPRRLPCVAYRLGELFFHGAAWKTKQNKAKQPENEQNDYMGRHGQNRPADPPTFISRSTHGIHPPKSFRRTVDAEHARPTYDAASKTDYQRQNNQSNSQLAYFVIALFQFLNTKNTLFLPKLLRRRVQLGRQRHRPVLRHEERVLELRCSPAVRRRRCPLVRPHNVLG